MNIVRYLYYLHVTTHTSLSPIQRGFVSSLVNYKKGCTRLAAASDKVYQLLAHGRWLSPGTQVSSITKTGRHDIAEILLKVALKHNQSIKIRRYQRPFQVGKSTQYLILPLIERPGQLKVKFEQKTFKVYMYKIHNPNVEINLFI